MKKLFCLILALAMVLSLAACGNGSSGKQKIRTYKTDSFNIRESEI